MSANEQPSILTVCVPGVDADPGVLDLNAILAAREKAALASRFAGASGDSNTPAGDCDDSACGIDAVADSSAGATQRMSLGTGSNSCCNLNSRDGKCERINSDGGQACTCTPSFFHADSGKKALELMRMLRFDLLVTGDRLPDMPVGHLIRRVRAAWPWQKWAMVGASITTQDEIVARTLGALAVFDAPPDWESIGSLAAMVAVKAEADARCESLQIANSREHGFSALERSMSVAPSHRVGGSGCTSDQSTRKNSVSRRSAVLSLTLQDRSAI